MCGLAFLLTGDFSYLLILSSAVQKLTVLCSFSVTYHCYPANDCKYCRLGLTADILQLTGVCCCCCSCCCICCLCTVHCSSDDCRTLKQRLVDHGCWSGQSPTQHATAILFLLKRQPHGVTSFWAKCDCGVCQLSQARAEQHHDDDFTHYTSNRNACWLS